MPGVARQTTGSSPQSAVPNGTDVSPMDVPKSNIWNRSPAKNASVTVSSPPWEGNEIVQGGEPRKLVAVPELGIQNAPLGSASWQPVAGVPASENANSRKTLGVTVSAAAPIANAKKSAGTIMQACLFCLLS